MSEAAALQAAKQVLSRRLLVVLFVVVSLVGPLGYAMIGGIGLGWTVPGAVVWTLLFAFAGARTGKSYVACGTS